MSQRNLKYTCGVTQPSGCVLYTGNFPAFIDESTLECNPNIDLVLELYGAKIDSILASIDFTDLDKSCYDFSPATVKASELHQMHIDKICSLQSSVDALQLALQGLDVGSQEVTVDLKCLTPVAAPCQLGTHTYTLSAVLQTLVTEICAIKTSLNL